VLGPLEQPQLLNPNFLGNSFELSCWTEPGWNYRLDYKRDLTSDYWLMLPPVPGDSGNRKLRDESPVDTQRFYRAYLFK
jgi:hypothetical protein